MRYRPEIDGLRAVAVVPVVLFHVHPSLMPGGFLGVDVFFVISGFLITTILLEDLAAERFSIVRFYERRLRRIAPALLFVCLACLPFAALWMLPSELDAFGKSLLNSLLMVANFDLWGDDYFAPSNDLKPLLHMWSLAVEEQFYLVFPLLLFLMRHTSRERLFAVVALLAVASFLLTWPVSRMDPVGNFYLPMTRFWELAAGALLAIRTPDGFVPGKGARAVLANGGLLAVLGACLFLPSMAHQPGPATLIPVVGTLLIIAFASPQNLAGRLLALRPIVGIGMISYSLYLWHQPVFAFARIRAIEPIAPGLYVLLIGLAFALAVFSYVFIETPFRRGNLFSLRQVAACAGGAAGLMIILGIGVSEADGFPNRGKQFAAIMEPSYGLGKECRDASPSQACRSKPQPAIAVWGDSYAMHLVEGMIASQPEDAPGLVQLTKSTCGPFFDLAPTRDNRGLGWSGECLRYNAAVRAYLTSTPMLRYVVVSTQLTKYLKNQDLVTADNRIVQGGYEVALNGLRRTLTWLREVGLKPVVFAPTPRDGRDAGICVSRTLLLGESSEECDKLQPQQAQFDADVERIMSDLAQDFPVVTLKNHLCDGTTCRVTDQGVPIFMDDGHLSSQGSKHLGKRLDFYHSLINAAEQGCLPGSDRPRGICQLKPSVAAGSGSS